MEDIEPGPPIKYFTERNMLTGIKGSNTGFKQIYGEFPSKNEDVIITNNNTTSVYFTTKNGAITQTYIKRKKTESYIIWNEEIYEWVVGKGYREFIWERHLFEMGISGNLDLLQFSQTIGNDRRLREIVSIMKRRGGSDQKAREFKKLIKKLEDANFIELMPLLKPEEIPEYLVYPLDFEWLKKIIKSRDLSVNGRYSYPPLEEDIYRYSTIGIIIKTYPDSEIVKVSGFSQSSDNGSYYMNLENVKYSQIAKIVLNRVQSIPPSDSRELAKMKIDLAVVEDNARGDVSVIANTPRFIWPKKLKSRHFKYYKSHVKSKVLGSLLYREFSYLEEFRKEYGFPYFGNSEYSEEVFE